MSKKFQSRFAARALALALFTGVAVVAPVASSAVTAAVAGVTASTPKADYVAGEALIVSISVPKTAAVHAKGSVSVTWTNELTGKVVVAPLTLVNGKTSYNTRNQIKPGPNVFEVAYPGDVNYGSSSSRADVIVAKGGTTTAASVPATVASGALVPIKATTTIVAPAKASLTSKVTYTATNGATVVTKFVGVSSTGTAATWSPKLANGTWAITAAYSANTDFNASTSAPATIVVGAPASTVDQEAGPGTGGFAGGTDSETSYIDLFQTFTAGRSGTLDKITLHPRASNNPLSDPVMLIDIVTLDESGFPTTTVIGSGSWPIAATGGLVDMPLSSPAVVQAGTEYAMVLSTPRTGYSTMAFQYIHQNEELDGYEGGRSGYIGNGFRDFMYPLNDMVFETWVR